MLESKTMGLDKTENFFTTLLLLYPGESALELLWARVPPSLFLGAYLILHEEKKLFPHSSISTDSDASVVMEMDQSLGHLLLY